MDRRGCWDLGKHLFFTWGHGLHRGLREVLQRTLINFLHHHVNDVLVGVVFFIIKKK
jgi:hypothetical protein